MNLKSYTFVTFISNKTTLIKNGYNINLLFIHCKYFQQVSYLHNSYIYDYIVYNIMVLERCGGGVQAGLSFKNIISKEKFKFKFKTDNKIIYSLVIAHNSPYTFKINIFLRIHAFL